MIGMIYTRRCQHIKLKIAVVIELKLANRHRFLRTKSL